MPARIAQARFPLGGWWFIAIAWPLVIWLWTKTPDNALTREQFITNCVIEGFLCLVALYFTYEKVRFPDSTLVVDAPPVPGHDFLARIDTPMKNEPAAGMKIRLEVVDPSKRNPVTIWRADTVAHLTRGERGVVARIEVRIPKELEKDTRPRRWLLAARARVPFGLYRAHFPVSDERAN